MHRESQVSDDCQSGGGRREEAVPRRVMAWRAEVTSKLFDVAGATLTTTGSLKSNTRNHGERNR